MENVSKFEKEKLLYLLECTDKELDDLIQKLNDTVNEEDAVYDVLLKILQQGLNIREATLLGIILGEKVGYKQAKIEMEEAIKDKLYRAFKNNQ